MALTPGTRFGPYEIAEAIGAGGMGEVYRATDANLKRDVAIKVLPSALANDADRLARFQREAEVLASLNHSNIAHIYGLERSDGTTALAMELVEGPTLAERIEQGPIPAEEALGIALQIADGLEAAHARGIVHRDLKPANIKLATDGTVKVLDFGIAKALDTHVTSGPQAPALTTPAMTEAGIVLGTAQYMSPEQARGKPVDQRADIWAFGCVLYEMLTGQPAFGGEDVTIVLARVLERGADLSALPAELSPAVRQTINLCLQKDPKKRVADIRDVKLALEGAFETPIEAVAREVGGGKPSRRSGSLAAAALVSAGLAGLIGWSLAPRATGSAPTTRFIVRTLGDVPLTTRLPLTLSPDGRELVYSAGRQPAEFQLFHQSLAGFEPSAIDGSLGGSNPFFSPRGDTVGFDSLVVGGLQRLALTGGSASRLVDRVGFLGASWGEDGTLVLSDRWGGPLRIARVGESEAVDLTRLDPEAGQQSHVSPQILPGKRGVLFTIWSGAVTWDEAELAVADFETGQHTVVLRGGASGRYAKSGHLVFWRGNALLAVPFDLGTLTVHGEPVRVVSDVQLARAQGLAHFAMSDTGTLAYIQGRDNSFSESFIVDRKGQRSVKLDESVSTGAPVFSPDGTQLALTLFRGGAYGVGVFDLDRGQLTPFALTQDTAAPSWTSNGDRVAFVSSRDGEYSLYTMRADGSGTLEPVFAEAQGYADIRSAWSRDGRYLAYEKRGVGSTDIWMQERVEDAVPRPLIATRAAESAPAFSPDGRQIAYQSDESGRLEIYVRPFPDVDARRELISRSGGRRPAWSSDGSEIFYVSDAGLMTVPVVSNENGVPRFGQPVLLFEMSAIGNFDVSPDAQTFAIQRSPIETLAHEIHVVTNWFDELERLVPTK